CSASIKGTYRLENKTAAEIPVIYVTLNDRAVVDRLSLGRPAQESLKDEPLGFRALKLDAPLRPGESTELSFDIRYVCRGFENEPSDRSLVENGTFLNMNVFPVMGYLPGRELESDNARRKHGLKVKERMRPESDARGLAENGLASDS